MTPLMGPNLARTSSSDLLTRLRSVTSQVKTTASDPEFPDCSNSAHTLRAQAVSGKSAQHAVPLFVRRQLAACEQREFDLRKPRNMLRNLQRNTSETPGDDVDAAVPQPGRGVLRGRDFQFVERLNPAGCPSQRDQAIGRRPQ